MSSKKCNTYFITDESYSSVYLTGFGKKKYWMNYCYHYLISSRSSIKRSLKGWNCSIHFLKTPFIPPETSKSLLKKKDFFKAKNSFKVNLKNTVKKFLCSFIESIFQVTGCWSIAQVFSGPLTIEWSSLVLMNMGGLRNMRWASLSSWERVRVGLIFACWVHLSTDSFLTVFTWLNLLLFHRFPLLFSLLFRLQSFLFHESCWEPVTKHLLLSPSTHPSTLVNLLFTCSDYISLNLFFILEPEVCK